MSYNYTSDTQMSFDAAEVSKSLIASKDEDGDKYHIFVIVRGSEDQGYVASVEIFSEDSSGAIVETVLDPVYQTRKEKSSDTVAVRATKEARKFARSEGYDI